MIGDVDEGNLYGNALCFLRFPVFVMLKPARLSLLARFKRGIIERESDDIKTGIKKPRCFRL